MKKKENVNFGALITASIEIAKIKQVDVIAESGISRSTYYRAIGAGGKASKPHVVALVRAINKLARKAVIDENEALRRAGFDAALQNPMTIQIDTGVQLIVEKSKFSKKGFRV
jgi:DNA-binding phage protein